MIKQVLILAASICGIAIVVASTTGNDTPAPVPAETETDVRKAPPVVPTQAKADDDYYSDDDESDFVFGEPVTYSEDDEEIQNEGPAEIVKAPAQSKPSPSYARKRSTKFPNSPKPGDPGSKENPIDMSPPVPRT